jgi:hypothetical protein
MKPLVRIFAMVVLGLVAFSTPSSAQNEPDPWMAAITGDLNTLQRALEAGVNPDVREPNGSTPLMLATMFGQTDLVPFLIERKAQLNIQNNDGASALFLAAFFGHPEIVTLLLEAGAATDLRNNDGVTPLEAVSGPWSEELRGLYEFFDGIFQMQLDIDRIREVRPEVHAILQAAG